MGHRAAGVWAFDSYNGNCMATAQQYMEQSGADVCLVQESRVADARLRTAERTAARTGWSLSLEAAVWTEMDSTSAGVGVAVRRHIGHSDVASLPLHPSLHSRVRVSWVRAMCKGGIFCLSAYFWHSEGLSRRNLDLLEYIAQITRRLHGPWLLAADFNFPPDVLIQSGWLQLVNGRVHAPDQPTCNAQIHGYFVVDSRLQQSVLGVALVIDTGARPHSAVRFWMRGKPRRHMVRVLAQPYKARPLPPQGCLPENASKGFEGIADVSDAG